MKTNMFQKDGRFIPTPHGSILHPSRPPRCQQEVKNRFWSRTTQILKFLKKFHNQLLASPFSLAKYCPPAALTNASKLWYNSHNFWPMLADFRMCVIQTSEEAHSFSPPFRMGLLEFTPHPPPYYIPYIYIYIIFLIIVLIIFLIIFLTRFL